MTQLDELAELFDSQITTELPSEWAAKYRVLTSEVTAFPGRASLDRFPYWKEPLNRLSPDDPTRIITIMGGAQIGKSTNFIESGIGYIIKNHPGNIILTAADETLVKTAMSKKIDQMLANSGLRYLIRPNTIKKKNLKTGDTDTLKEFPGGSLMAQSIKAVDKVKQNSFQYGFFDDFEAATRSEKQAGDIASLLMMRFNSFKDKMKICFISTPEIKQTSVIEPAFYQGDQRYYFMPCPCCGAYIRYEWYAKIEGEEKIHAGVVFEKDSNNNLIENSVGYVCPECKEFFTEKHKREMLNNGIWKPTGTPSRPDWKSYHISGLYSPPGFFDWTHHARQWLKIFPQGGQVRERELQVFNNLVLGLTYEERKKEINSSLISRNLRDYEICTIPTNISVTDGNGKIILLTCACDLNGTEDDARIDYEVLAHSMNGSTYSIDAGSIGSFQRGISKEQREIKSYTHGSENSVWTDLTKIIKKEYITQDGEILRIAIAGIDTGYFTQIAYQYIDLEITGINLVGLKGDSEEKKRNVSADTPCFKESRERVGLYLVQSNQIKDTLSEFMKLKYSKGYNQPAGFMNYPSPSDGKYDYRYFEQYEGEQRKPIVSATGIEIAYMWEKKTQQSKNHFWDCFDKHTEVMTENGWMLFKDLSENCKLGTVNLDTSSIEFQTPSCLISKQYTGNMISIQGNKTSIVVTPTHRMVAHRKYSGKMSQTPEIVLAKDLKITDNLLMTGEINRAGNEFYVIPELKNKFGNLIADEKRIPSKIWAAFLGLYISEGSRSKNYQEKRGSFSHRVQINQNKGQKYDKMKMIIEQLPFNFNECKSKGEHENYNFVITQKQLYLELENCGSTCYTKKVPSWLKIQSKEVIEEFLKYAVLGDGYVNKKDGHTKYYTTSKQLADDMQYLAVLVGFQTTMRSFIPPKCNINRLTENMVMQHHISFNKRKVAGLRKNNDTKSASLINEMHYDDMVYCATVPNGTLILRRDNKTFVAGNCRVYNMALRDIFVKTVSKSIGKTITWLEFCELIQ